VIVFIFKIHRSLVSSKNVAKSFRTIFTKNQMSWIPAGTLKETTLLVCKILLNLMKRGDSIESVPKSLMKIIFSFGWKQLWTLEAFLTLYFSLLPSCWTSCTLSIIFQLYQLGTCNFRRYNFLQLNKIFFLGLKDHAWMIAFGKKCW
jgi:hypothetical protein